MLASLVLVLVVGCGGDDGYQEGAPVVDLVGSGCSTQVVLDLSLQIAEEMHCLDDKALAPFAESAGVVFASDAILPYLSAAASLDLEAAVATYGGEIVVNSGFRTLAQQYLLYAWNQLGTCNIAAAAVPGNSNHESGRALDIANYGDWVDVLPDFGWEQTVPGDPVHFDHLPSADIRGLDVLAFQMIWNRNNPDDPIDEDGLYGPMTEARLEQAPSNGFRRSGPCTAN